MIRELAVLELWATERALRSEPWLQEPGAPRLQVKRERALTGAAGTDDHQGVLAYCEPYRYADGLELAAQPEPMLVCLDRVTDPHNLGAVCRSVEGAGATGIVLPAHGSVRVTPAVCRASAGAVPTTHFAGARYLRSGSSGSPMWQTDLSGGVALVLGAEGKGVRPLVRRACDGAVSIPLSGKVESLNVSVAAALLLYETARQRASARAHA